MNKTSFLPVRILIRCIAIAAVCIPVFSTDIQAARADGAPPPEPDMGGVAPYQPIETNVQMTSETVLIDVLPHPTRWTGFDPYFDSNLVKVSASFTLRNQGTEEEKMQVIFPLTRLDYPWLTSSYNIVESSFVAIVNDQPVPTSRLSTPPELQGVYEGVSPPDGFFASDVQWAGFDVTFPVQQDVIVQVKYDMQGYSNVGLHHVDYILETGAGWYGRILSADIILRLPYLATRESAPWVPPGCIFSGNEVQCKRKNFEPKRTDNLAFGFIDTNEWSPTLELRSRVEQHPDDADAWYRLGERYNRLGFWWEDRIVNQHMVDLSIEAFERAVALRPDWGDAHCQLARSLWFNNPKLIRGPGGSAIQEHVSADDPLVQRVVQELNATAYHGITEGNYCYLGSEVNAIPGLESAVPASVNFISPSKTPTTTPAPMPASIQKVIALGVGNYHTCVLTADELKCPGERVVSDEFTAVVTGDFYSCMLTRSGGVQCMGRNNFGQLGDGTTISRNTPVDVKGLTSGVSALVVGDNHTCALTMGGGVKCWGRNYFGQLGDGTTAYSLVPVDVHGLDSGVALLAAGSDHTCALMRTGGIKCWGANESGQLGDGSLVDCLEPVEIGGLPDNVTALAAGFAHTCALAAQGQVMCWGDNRHGQLGNANLIVHTAPVIVPGLDGGVVKVTAGNGFTCAMTGEGGVKCWGRNDEYKHQLGDSTVVDRTTPGDVIGLTRGAVDMAAGNDHTCAILQNGKVRCWGWADYGYNDAETDYGIEIAPTPAAFTESPTYTPMPPPTAVPVELSAPVRDSVWDLALLLAIGGLFLGWRRFRVGKRK